MVQPDRPLGASPLRFEVIESIQLLVLLKVYNTPYSCVICEEFLPALKIPGNFEETSINFSGIRPTLISRVEISRDLDLGGARRPHFWTPRANPRRLRPIWAPSPPPSHGAPLRAPRASPLALHT